MQPSWGSRGPAGETVVNFFRIFQHHEKKEETVWHHAPVSASLNSVYMRRADMKLMRIGMQWAREMRLLTESGRIKALPLREVDR
ncbi:hypothetical protein B0H67DRAFT_686104, partial [Lasiosphaeris hirsuta]